MLPPATAVELQRLGHDATSVHSIGLVNTPDADVFAFAIDHGLVIVTENRDDFVRLSKAQLERGRSSAAIIFVDKRDLPSGGGLPYHLARRLDRWASAHPEPSHVVYWLPSDG